MFSTRCIEVNPRLRSFLQSNEYRELLSVLNGMALRLGDVASMCTFRIHPKDIKMYFQTSELSTLDLIFKHFRALRGPNEKFEECLKLCAQTLWGLNEQGLLDEFLDKAEKYWIHGRPKQIQRGFVLSFLKLKLFLYPKRIRFVIFWSKDFFGAHTSSHLSGCINRSVQCKATRLNLESESSRKNDRNVSKGSLKKQK